jgi:hypothetical protein
MAEQQGSLGDVSGSLDHALILVAVMPSPRDMEIARVLGWYRIPFKFAPKIVYVDYLAFYQPSVFGKEQANCISVIAPVRGVELTTRRELFRDEEQHPRAEEEYYKIQIGALQALPKPIIAGEWKRITFLYTTGEYLQKANYIKDLVIKDDERRIVWRSLRERRAQFLAESNETKWTEDIDNDVLLMLSSFHAISEDDELFIDY